MNKVTLLGRLTRDPEFDQTTSGISVAKFTLAVNRRYTNEDGEREADFINIVAWRTNADICHKYLKKGSKIAVVGSIQNRSYEGTDGTKKFTTDIMADEIEFLSTKNDGENAGATMAPNVESNHPVADLQPIDDDSLPF